MFWWWKRRSNQSKSLRHDSLLRGKGGGERGRTGSGRRGEDAETATAWVQEIRMQRAAVVSQWWPQWAHPRGNYSFYCASNSCRCWVYHFKAFLLNFWPNTTAGKQAANRPDIQENEQWRKTKTLIHHAGAERSPVLLNSQCLSPLQSVSSPLCSLWWECVTDDDYKTHTHHPPTSTSQRLCGKRLVSAKKQRKTSFITDTRRTLQK